LAPKKAGTSNPAGANSSNGKVFPAGQLLKRRKTTAAEAALQTQAQAKGAAAARACARAPRAQTAPRRLEGAGRDQR